LVAQSALKNKNFPLFPSFSPLFRTTKTIITPVCSYVERCVLVCVAIFHRIPIGTPQASLDPLLLTTSLPPPWSLSRIVSYQEDHSSICRINLPTSVRPWTGSR
jgi:hypothetical protein